jgi:hypothetical protein
VVSSETRTFPPAIDLKPGISNVMAPHLPRQLITMAGTVADQFAEVPAAVGVNRTYGIVGDSLNQAICGASGKLS